MAEVDVGLPIPLPSGGYLDPRYASPSAPIDPSIILGSPVQTGMNNAAEAQAMDPITQFLMMKAAEEASDRSGLTDTIKNSPPGKLARTVLGGLLDAIVPPAQAAETGQAADAGFAGQPAMAQSPAMPPVQQGMPSIDQVRAMNYVPDSQIPMEGRRLPTNERILVRQDWQGPGRGLASGDTLPDGSMPVNMDGEVISAAQRLRDLGAKSIPDAGMKAQEELKKLADPRTPDNTPKSGGFLDTLKGFFGDEERMATLAIAFNSMRLNPDANLAAAMQKRIERAGDRRKANRTADYLESIGQKQAADLIRQNPSIAGEVLKEFVSGDQTTAFRTLQARAKAAGLEEGTPAYQNFMRTGGQSFAGGLQVGSIPAGYQLVERDGGVRLEPIPGGEAERKQAEAARQRQTQGELASRAGGVVFEDIGRLQNLVEEDPILNPVLGVTGAIASFIPGTNRVDAESLAQTIRANIGFDRLQQMREASPTGGALGQVSNQELSTLQSVLGNLSLSQSQDQVLQNLDRLKKIYADILKKAQAYPNAADFGFGVAAQEATSNDPMGIL